MAVFTIIIAKVYAGVDIVQLYSTGDYDAQWSLLLNYKQKLSGATYAKDAQT